MNTNNNQITGRSVKINPRNANMLKLIGKINCLRVYNSRDLKNIVGIYKSQLN